MQPLEIDSAVFCDGAHYTIISRENSSILTCPVASGAGGYTLNRVEVRALGTALPVREHAFTRPRPDHIIRAISTSPPLFRGGSL